ISVSIPKGEIFGLIGPNGAGKTTLMKMIVGEIFPNEGNIKIFGKNKHKERINHRIGSLIEKPGLYPDFSAIENLRIQSSYMGIRRKGYAEDVLKKVGLDPNMKKKVKKFSLGMKQRLGIAMAMMGDADILLLDEPINGMDPDGIIEFRNMIKKIHEEHGITMIISSHLLDELSRQATSFGFLKDGKLLKYISRDELKEECRDYIEIKTKYPEKMIPFLEQRFKDFKYSVRESGYINLFDDSLSEADYNKIFIENNISYDSVKYKKYSIESYYKKIMGGSNV
ncbi:MAG: ABC transporter ATP-binding protein, partial [Tissierellia bacterium]|nr:ABC transporter ATP-binding protein [Tissierellia bacterium]